MTARRDRGPTSAIQFRGEIRSDEGRFGRPEHLHQLTGGQVILVHRRGGPARRQPAHGRLTADDAEHHAGAAVAAAAIGRAGGVLARAALVSVVILVVILGQHGLAGALADATADRGSGIAGLGQQQGQEHAPCGEGRKASVFAKGAHLSIKIHAWIS